MALLRSIAPTASATPDAPPAHAPRDRGFTLSEVVVAIGLTGILILAVVSSAWTLIRTSRVSDDQAAVEAVLGGAADEISVLGWQACPLETNEYLEFAQRSASRVSWPASAVQIEGIEYWDISSNSWSGNNPFGVGSDCEFTPTVAASSRMQRVTFRSSAPGGTQSRTLQVVVAEIRFLDEQDTD